MTNKKFDTKKLKKLNNPQRLIDIPPDYIQDKLNLKQSNLIVEIGAGTAFFSLAFHHQLQASTTYACDISQVMIDWIKENISPDNPGIVPVKTSENSVPLESDIADIVFTIALHHELDNPSLVLDESYRLLTPGGKLFIVDWKKEEMDQGPPIEIRSSPQQIKGALVESRFGNVQIFNTLPKHFLITAEKI